MATHQGTRPSRPQPKPIPKPALYEAIFFLNRDLELVVEDFRRLRDLQFRREFMDAFAVKIEELRCWTNTELLETQNNRELKEWNHWSGLNRQFDAQFHDPEDVLIEAEIIRKERAGKKRRRRQ